MLFDWVGASEHTTKANFSDKKGFRYLNGVPLSDTHFYLEVNFLEYWEHTPHGDIIHWSWVTDIPVDNRSLMTLIRGARARWKIVNEPVTTLKNPGYHGGHHCGHGHQHLSTELMHLMMLALLIDQIQQRTCRLFQSAVKAADGKTRFWRLLRSFFDFLPYPRMGDPQLRHHPPSRWSATRREAAP